jgi:multicomponent Na+:H+ antiporter subunit E
MLAHLMLSVMLALLWCLLLEQFSARAFVVGYLIGTALLFVLRRMTGETVFFRKLGVCLRLAAVFAWDMLVANVQVAWWILRPRLRVQPALIRLPIRLKSDAAITMLANMISLTPGTLTVDVAADRTSLLVHCLNVPNIEAAKRTIREHFEKPLLELEQ